MLSFRYSQLHSPDTTQRQPQENPAKPCVHADTCMASLAQSGDTLSVNQWSHSVMCILRVLSLVSILGCALPAVAPPVNAAGPVTFVSIADNRSEYSDSRVPEFGKLEVTFSLSVSYANPFAPYPVNPTSAITAQVDADGAKADAGGATATAVLTSPSSRVLSVPAFCFSDCESGQNHVWKVRFAPSEVGTYQYRLQVVDARGTSTSDTRNVDVVASQNDGFVRVAPGSRFFRYDSGRTFIPTGANNLKKSHDRSVIDYYRQNLYDNNMNMQRIWLHPNYTAIEWISNRFGVGRPAATALGRYDLAMADNMDYIVESGVGLHYVLAQDDMICYANARETDIAWGHNPYQQITTNINFFTDAQAKAYYKRRLRYMISRWGYSTKIVAWEIMNEVDWPILDGDWTGDPLNVVAWHEEMGQYMKRVDVHHHMITANTASSIGRYPNDPNHWFWRLHNNPSVDFTNHHMYYQPEVGYYVQTVDAFARNCPVRPYLMTEWGLSAQGAQDTADFMGIHNAGWTGIMYSGNAPFTWWWDLYYSEGYRQFKYIAAFMQGEDYLRDDLSLKKYTSSSTTVESFGLGSGDKILAWAHDTSCVYSGGSGPPTRQGVRISATGLKDGPFRVEFWNTWTGTLIRADTLAATSGRLEIPLPTFTGDVAIKAKWAGTPANLQKRSYLPGVFMGAER